jgi:hypothetical protein
MFSFGFLDTKNCASTLFNFCHDCLLFGLIVYTSNIPYSVNFVYSFGEGAAIFLSTTAKERSGI